MVDFHGFQGRTAAEMALYASDAEQLFRNILNTTPTGRPTIPATAPSPTADPTMARVNSGDWLMVGELRADDDLRNLQFLKQIFGLEQNNYFFGFLLKRITPDPYFNPGDFLVIVRGTLQPIEWLLNICAAPDIVASKAHQIDGQVPVGFYSIYQSMTLRDGGGAVLGSADDEIAKIVNGPQTARLMVVGHSLGSALATYLMWELAQRINRPADQLFGYLFASPRTGDDTFVKAFSRGGANAMGMSYKGVPNYNVVNFARDIVPRVPPIGFETLLGGSGDQNIYIIDQTNTNPALFPTNDPGDNHNCINYAKMLSGDPNITPAVSPR